MCLMLVSRSKNAVLTMLRKQFFTVFASRYFRVFKSDSGGRQSNGVRRPYGENGRSGEKTNCGGSGSSKGRFGGLYPLSKNSKNIAVQRDGWGLCHPTETEKLQIKKMAILKKNKKHFCR